MRRSATWMRRSRAWTRRSDAWMRRSDAWMRRSRAWMRRSARSLWRDGARTRRDKTGALCGENVIQRLSANIQIGRFCAFDPAIAMRRQSRSPRRRAPGWSPRPWRITGRFEPPAPICGWSSLNGRSSIWIDRSLVFLASARSPTFLRMIARKPSEVGSHASPSRSFSGRRRAGWAILHDLLIPKPSP